MRPLGFSSPWWSVSDCNRVCIDWKLHTVLSNRRLRHQNPAHALLRMRSYFFVSHSRCRKGCVCEVGRYALVCLSHSCILQMMHLQISYQHAQETDIASPALTLSLAGNTTAFLITSPKKSHTYPITSSWSHSSIAFPSLCSTLSSLISFK